MEIDCATTQTGLGAPIAGSPSLVLGSSNNWATANQLALGHPNATKAGRLTIDRAMSATTMSVPSRPRRDGRNLNTQLTRNIVKRGTVLGGR